MQPSESTLIGFYRGLPAAAAPAPRLAVVLAALPAARVACAREYRRAAAR